MTNLAHSASRPVWWSSVPPHPGIEHLARFAYVPLFPAMVAPGWVTGAQGGFLGAVNFAGYLIGVLGGRTLAGCVGTARALDAGMRLAALAFAACAWNGGLAWLALWRAAAGVAGGVLMALAGPAVQGATPPEQRGAAGGLVVAGVGSGVIVASLAVPMLLPAGLPAAWLSLAALVLGLWAYAHPRWPQTPVLLVDSAAPRPNAGALILAYGLSGAGMVPHMVYFVDLAVRGRDLDPRLGALTWLLFGTGAILGTLIGGRAADRWGGPRALKVWLAFQAAALALTLPPYAVALFPAALLSGFGGLGVTAVALARARELAGPAASVVWVRATALYALAQAATGFALTPLFAYTGSHTVVFAVGLALSVAALLAAIPDE